MAKAPKAYFRFFQPAAASWRRVRQRQVYIFFSLLAPHRGDGANGKFSVFSVRSDLLAPKAPTENFRFFQLALQLTVFSRRRRQWQIFGFFRLQRPPRANAANGKFCFFSVRNCLLAPKAPTENFRVFQFVTAPSRRQQIFGFFGLQ